MQSEAGPSGKKPSSVLWDSTIVISRPMNLGESCLDEVCAFAAESEATSIGRAPIDRGNRDKTVKCLL